MSNNPELILALDRIADAARNLPSGATFQTILELAEDALAGTRTGESDHVAHGVNALVAFAHDASTAAGWWIDPNTGRDYAQSPDFGFVVATKLMLIVSEISEAMEGHRKGLMDDKLPHRRMIEVELGDALLRIGDLAGKLGLDLGGAVVEKAAFNAVRPDHKPGARTIAGGKAY